jgi:Zn-dependent peptidase ImmA (M78 family)
VQNTHYLDPVERWAESAWRRLDLQPMVDLYAVTDYLNIRVVRKGFTTAAATGVYWITPKGRAVILINKHVELIERQRWTLAHEIGHHLLRKPGDTGRICVLGIPSMQADPAIERKCDKFAAALLMPHWIVKEWWNELSSNPSGRISIIANRLGVSLSAMRIRAKELNLKDKRRSRLVKRSGV